MLNFISVNRRHEAKKEISWLWLRGRETSHFVYDQLMRRIEKLALAHWWSNLEELQERANLFVFLAYARINGNLFVQMFVLRRLAFDRFGPAAVSLTWSSKLLVVLSYFPLWKGSRHNSVHQSTLFLGLTSVLSTDSLINLGFLRKVWQKKSVSSYQ